MTSNLKRKAETPSATPPIKRQVTDQHICLQRGMVLLRGYLDLQQQRTLLSSVQRFGEQPGGFYDCDNEKTKRMRMMNLGISTAPPHKAHTLSIPDAWQRFAAVCIQAAQTQDPSLSELQPANVCVVNHYTTVSKLGWHQGESSGVA